MSSGNSSTAGKQYDFATTRWSMIREAGAEDSDVANSALQELCQQYWYPLYTFVRRQGHDSNSAADLTQAFFADILQRRDLETADPELGRFRSFLLASVRNFISNQRDKDRAQKRGGGKKPLSFDFQDAEGRYLQHPAENSTPESLFERQWAMTLLGRVEDRLRKEFEKRGKAHVFDELKIFLAGKSRESTLAAAAAGLSMTEVAAKVAVHRMRARFGELLRSEIQATVESDDSIDAEIQHLFSVLQSP